MFSIPIVKLPIENSFAMYYSDSTDNRTRSLSASKWKDYLVIGDAFRIEFYGYMLDMIKREYCLEAFHNTVQAWIDYRDWMRYPYEWKNIERLIESAHLNGLPVGVATGYHVADSVDASYSAHVGFLHYYRSILDTEWRYPNGNLAVDPYTVGASRSFTGKLVIRVLGEELGRRDFIAVMQPQNPYWLDFLVSWGEKVVDAGADAIFFDSPDAIFVFFWGGGWGCADTWEGRGFIEYLKARFDPEELESLGVSLEDFCLRDYLREKYRLKNVYGNYIYFRKKFETSWPTETVEFFNKDQVLADPIFKEALLYWYESAINFSKELSRRIKKYAQARDRDILITSNEYFAWIPHITLTPYMDVIYVETNQFKIPPYQKNGVICKMALASGNYSKPVWIGEWVLWFSNPFEPDPPPQDVSTLIKIRIAETYSAGAIMLVPFGTGHPLEGWPPRRLVLGREWWRGEVSKYYRFISEHRELFQKTSSYAKVALLVSLPTAVWNYVPALGIYESEEYQREVYGWAAALESLHIDYDVLLLGMSRILSTNARII